MSVSKDLSTFPNWQNISIGQHTLKIKAKAANFIDSDFSIAYTFIKYGDLDAPELTLFDDMLYITGDENSESFDLYVDGVVEENIPAEEEYSYQQVGEELTISNSPYQQNGEELIIG